MFEWGDYDIKRYAAISPKKYSQIANGKLTKDMEIVKDALQDTRKAFYNLANILIQSTANPVLKKELKEFMNKIA